MTPPTTSRKGALLPMREWAYVHSELEWIYDHEVPAAYRESKFNKRRGGYSAWFIRKGRAAVSTARGPGASRRDRGSGSWCRRRRSRNASRPTRTSSRCTSTATGPRGENILAGDGGLVLDGAEHPALERHATRLERMVRKHIPDADRRYYGCFSDYGRFLSFHILFQQWLALWFEAQREHGADITRILTKDDRLLQVLSRLNTAPLHEGLPHETIRRESGLSEAHLNRLFLAEYGMTVRKCWEQRRLKAARSHLETSLMPIKEVAYTLGFRSDSHFMMWFKTHTGKRPREYRQVHRGLTD